MSVRRFKRRTAAGNWSTGWVVDVVHRDLDNNEERFRRHPKRQTRADALALEQKLIEWLEQRDRRIVESRSQTVAEFSVEFLANYVSVNNKPSEAHTKAALLKNHLVSFFGAMKLNQISPRHIDAYKANCSRLKLSPKSINNHLAVMRKLLNIAADYELLGSLPKVRAMRLSPVDHVFLTEEEAQALVRAASPPWDGMVLVALHAGLRLGELLALQWTDICFVTGRLVVRGSDWRGIVSSPKSNRTREVPLTATLARHLAACLRLRSHLVFSREDGSPLTYQQCRRPLLKACAQAGVPAVQWHALRHTFASHIAMRGAPLKAIQELLGHASQAMTNRYAHLTPGVRRDVAALLQHHEQSTKVLPAK